MQDTIRTLAADLAPSIISIRRTLHAHPELGFEEVSTAQYIRNILTQMGILFHPLADTGTVGVIQGRNPHKRCIALRADMDALPIHELNEVSYRSTIDGRMHACGHDVHTANLIGTAMILYALREQWEGTIKLIFQPSEERNPSGALAMIDAGVLNNPKVEGIIGIHVHPEMEIGEVGFHAGPFMASADELYITVIGKGGHAAQPAHFISPITIASEIILELSKHTDMNIPVVLSIGKVEALGATNVIPDRATMAGTLRCFDESIRHNMHFGIKDICYTIAKKYGGDCKVNIVAGSPVLNNNTPLTALAMNTAVDYLGTNHVHELPIRMGAEDFAYYSQHVPACFYRIGTGNREKGITSPIHTPTFDIDEAAIELSMGLMSSIAINMLA